MAVLVGIDEAGFGPLLGPLVISSSTFLLPNQLLPAPASPDESSCRRQEQGGSGTADLWQVLRKSAANKRSRLAGRLLIADSKKAHNKSLGIKHLQRTVLAAFKCLGKEPATLVELMQMLCPEHLAQLDAYPWYREIGCHKILVDKADQAVASSVFTNDMASNGIRLLQLRSRCLEVSYYNKLISEVKNKASVLFTATSQLIQNAFDSFAGDGLHIIVDRQGGRVRYGPALLRMFPEMELRILREDQQTSSYELHADGKRMRLHFVVGADEHFLPVSLASMVSKYLRELLMANINRYFLGFNPDLKPTAGYWQDGLRFIKDLRKNLPHVQFDGNQLIRCR